ncbi:MULTISPECIES: carboxymuconolactone decarboxylase family protein [Brucella/Ochrobactrum group]|uniref:Carboxymuconolactone decarboxylase family protein n=1 Tax=Brucella pseudintermedia TaxID=370111 RepID=A0ABY5UAZ7_9HYPH|nr:MULTISPECIES: carboxymuconolactone decarboxylase family protein [Brucella/Ochrobactrum group]KAB2685595.1 carboxymuconolactone decarboxylase family protein [Brucella pseudintermedia]NKE76531.1 carboxymuconolactone decarboxylase family protein [Ochrobactrum sp. MC-1LL]TWH00771.1 AhpD family alkylhydroperoxidase [Ochrobactrum sp. J50]UWL59204.1 carboxymuconolactone decarboxylase family protein [Brucella pseudintermedia]WPM79594.1 carboxymuconolactone decarboxylase family protein [Brucella pse
MEARLVPYKLAPKIMQVMVEAEKAVSEAGLEYSLYELVRIRASQINGCAYCIHMHTRDARKAGETEERLYLVAAWRESPLFTPRERAALAWTEALTLIAQTRAPDEDFNALKEHFTDEEIVKLSMAINMINLWNRVAVGFRTVHPVMADASAA